jgi:hypothetical protein
VLGLYRDELDNPASSRRGLAELLVLKKRVLVRPGRCFAESFAVGCA